MVLISYGSAAADTPASFPTSITFTRVAEGFKRPTSITNAADGSGRLFVVEQRGTIRIIRNGRVLKTPFLDISRLVRPRGSEQGLLGLAFSPHFNRTGSFYVNYTNKVAVGNTVVAHFTTGTTPDRADPASHRQLLSIVQPYSNHNGGQLAFGPDQMLYIGTGDGGGGGSRGSGSDNGQSLTTLLGKLLRIDVSASTRSAPYTIPVDNPFGNEIWAYGLRNPWRFSFDRLTGDLYLGDVGQNLIEEIDNQPAGKGRGVNYGWNIMEGSQCFATPSCSPAGLVMPVAEYRHGHGDCSITGGYVYRGKIRALRGIYLFGDYCSGRIWGLRNKGTTWETKLLAETSFRISTFGEDEAGELYLADYATGEIYRLGAL